jgi:hypothetical protein
VTNLTEREQLSLALIPDGMHPADVSGQVLSYCPPYMTQREFLIRMVNLMRREAYEAARRDQPRQDQSGA